MCPSEPNTQQNTDTERLAEVVAEARNHVDHFPITEGDAVRVTRLADALEATVQRVLDLEATIASVDQVFHSTDVPSPLFAHSWQIAAAMHNALHGLDRCELCGGTGIYPGSATNRPETCEECDGHGAVNHETGDFPNCLSRPARAILEGSTTDHE